MTVSQMIKGRRHYPAKCNSCGSDRGWKIRQELDRMCNKCASSLANTKSQIARRCNTKKCSITGCEEKHFGKGFCNKHYERHRRPSSQGLEFECESPKCSNIFKRSGNQKYCSSACNTAAYYYRNKDKINEKRRGCNKIKQYREQYNRENRDKLTANKNRRYREDIQFRIKENLRTRLSKAIARNTKSGSAIEDLGCSIEELRNYLESKFQPGMSWDNYGEWHIDHIRPLANFDLSNRDQFLEACNYTNLQPLWAIDNIRKSNK